MAQSQRQFVRPACIGGSGRPRVTAGGHGGEGGDYRYPYGHEMPRAGDACAGGAHPEAIDAELVNRPDQDSQCSKALRSPVEGSPLPLSELRSF